MWLLVNRASWLLWILSYVALDKLSCLVSLDFELRGSLIHELLGAY